MGLRGRGQKQYPIISGRVLTGCPDGLRPLIVAELITGSEAGNRILCHHLSRQSASCRHLSTPGPTHYLWGEPVRPPKTIWGPVRHCNWVLLAPVSIKVYSRFCADHGTWVPCTFAGRCKVLQRV